MSKKFQMPTLKKANTRDWRKSKTGSRNVLGGSGKYWNKIAEQSEAKFKAKDIQPLPDYETTFDGWRER